MQKADFLKCIEEIVANRIGASCEDSKDSLVSLTDASYALSNSRAIFSLHKKNVSRYTADICT